MKLTYYFHPNTCCLFDCIVRSCSCGARGRKGRVVEDRKAAQAWADDAVGSMVAGDRVIMALRGFEETDAGFELHFLVE